MTNDVGFMGQLIYAGAIILGIVGVIYGAVCTRQTKREESIKENTEVMTNLNNNIVVLTDKFNTFSMSNHESHVNLHGRIDKHEELLQDHTLRIHELEIIKEREI